MFSVKKNFYYNSIGTIIYWFCQWALSVVVVRIAGFTVGGEFSTALNFSTIFFIIASFNSKPFQVSDLKPKYSDENYIAFRIVTLVIAVILLAMTVAFFDYSYKQKLIVFAFLLFKSIEVYIDVYHGIFQKMWRLDKVFFSLMLRGIFSLLIFSIVLFWGKNLFWSIIAMSFVSCIPAVMVDLKFAHIQKKIRIHASYTKIKELFLECLPLLSYSVFYTLATLVPRFFLQMYDGNKILGIYSSLAMPAMIIQLCVGFVLTPLTTLFSQMINEKRFSDYRKLFYKCIAIILSLTVIALFAAYLLGDFGLKILFGPKILAYSQLLLPLLIISGLTALVFLLSSINIILRENKILLISAILGLTFTLAASPSLIKSYSMMGVNVVAMIALIVQVIALIIPIYKIMRKSNNQRIEYELEK